MPTSDLPSAHRPGEVVSVVVYNALEHAGSAGKRRPAVLVRRQGGRWLVMGLTTKPAYASGVPRVAVPDPAAVGLAGPGHLWGDRLTAVSALDVGEHIGWVDHALAEAVAELARLPAADRRALHDAAEAHHPRPPSRRGSG